MQPVSGDDEGDVSQAEFSAVPQSQVRIALQQLQQQCICYSRRSQCRRVLALTLQQLLLLRPPCCNVWWCREGAFYVTLDQLVSALLVVNPTEPTFFEFDRMYLSPARLTAMLATLRGMAVKGDEAVATARTGRATVPRGGGGGEDGGGFRGMPRVDSGE